MWLERIFSISSAFPAHFQRISSAFPAHFQRISSAFPAHSKGILKAFSKHSQIAIENRDWTAVAKSDSVLRRAAYQICPDPDGIENITPPLEHMHCSIRIGLCWVICDDAATLSAAMAKALRIPRGIRDHGILPARQFLPARCRLLAPQRRKRYRYGHDGTRSKVAADTNQEIQHSHMSY